jgi:hypothetical protein
MSGRTAPRARRYAATVRGTRRETVRPASRAVGAKWEASSGPRRRPDNTRAVNAKIERPIEVRLTHGDAASYGASASESRPVVAADVRRLKSLVPHFRAALRIQNEPPYVGCYEIRVGRLCASWRNSRHRPRASEASSLWLDRFGYRPNTTPAAIGLARPQPVHFPVCHDGSRPDQSLQPERCY